MNLEKLKTAKKEKKLSYDDLAKLTGYSRSTITSIFLGYVEFPRHETIQAIENALGLNVEFTEEEKKQFNLGDHKIALSDVDKYRLNVLARAEEVLSKEFVDAQIKLLELATEKGLN